MAALFTENKELTGKSPYVMDFQWYFSHKTGSKPFSWLMEFCENYIRELRKKHCFT